MTILEDLYYGNITPFERKACKDKRKEKLISLLFRNEANLKATFTEEQKELFVKLKDVEEELSSVIEREAFSDGYVLATKIMVEVMNNQEEQIV